ncbi:hypothetical protein ACOSQ3_009182 [Xanthoceras sorbifolium]
MALSLIPSSSSSAPQFKYDVFLSFRGEDTRYNFISHLHKALRDKQLEIVIDYDLNRGDEISPSLLEAIEESQVSIIIFSRNYASSRWCLEELVKILECRQQHGQIVIPVFYGIDPSDVRNQTGSFADAAKHEQKSSHKVQIWKDALKKAANLSGWHSTANKPENVLIEDIVQNVLKRLNDMSSVDTSDLVAIDSKIEEIESLLCIGTNDARSVGIWGIGGIGKTTLAEAVFNKISGQFEGFWFTYNVRERSEQSGGLNHLRQELRLAIFGDGNMNVCTSIVGRDFTRNRLNRKKLLLVFDDVSNFGQIEYLIGDLRCLNSQSRIIITTRDKQVLKNCGVNQVYEVRELFHEEALQLFCRYAFKRNYPMMDYVELSNKVARYGRGVPLALKVLGSHLFGKEKVVWKSAMDKLEKFPHIDIHKVLKISYDGLDDEVRKIFLDIACFWKGCDIELAKSILNACGFHTEIGISILMDQSLIAISYGNKITIHDLLQAMGREIVRQESINNPGKCSRLWHHEDIYHVLTKDTGTEIIEGISLDMSKTRDIHLDKNAFKNMRRLRFLKFYSSSYAEIENKVHGFQAIESDFAELRYLRWDGCPIKSPLSSFHLENLVKLDMRHSKVEQIWTGVKHLLKLKEIDLSFSSLTICPDLSGFPNLERLILIGCFNLHEISPSIQYLNKLDFLDLGYCKSLEGIPDCSDLISLKILDLTRCLNLEKLPEMPCNIEELLLGGTAIEELPLSTKYLSRLVVLDVSCCKMFKSLPSSICEWKSLKALYLEDCSKLDELPDDIGILDSLNGLEIRGTAIRELPSSITKLKNVDFLIFNRFEVQDAVSWSLPHIEGWHNLTSLNLRDSGIIELPDNLGCLSSLRELNLAGNSFESIPASIVNLSNLLYLNINDCKMLKCLPKLKLTLIHAYDCTSLEVLSCVSFKSCFQPRDNYDIFANFGNCFKLDRNTFENIVKDILLKIRGLIEYIDEYTRLSSGKMWRAFSVCPTFRRS